MVTNWIVTGYKCGNKMVEEVRANSQSDARDKFERLNPDYKAGSARRN